MIKYNLTNRDAMRTVMNSVPAAEVTFSDPIVQGFFEDQRSGLCTIQVRRHPPVVIAGDVQHHIVVSYYDPELEMVKRLSI